MTENRGKTIYAFRFLICTMRYIFLLLIPICFSVPEVLARQVHTSDSLLLQIEQQKTDTLKADIMLKIALEKYYTNTYEAIEYAQKALSIYEKLNSKKGIGRSNNIIGACYFSMADYSNAKHYFSLAYSYALKSNDSLYLAKSLNNLGNINLKTGKLEKATEQFIHAKSIYSSTNNFNGALGILNNLGEVYRSIGNYQKALDFYTESAELARESENEIDLSTVYQNISAVYTEIEEFDKALDACKKSYDLSSKNDFKSGMIKNLIAFGNIYQLTNNIDKALVYYNRGLTLSQESGYKDEEASILLHLGYIQLKKDNYLKARYYFSQSLELAEHSQNNELCLQNYNYLYFTDSICGDYKSAISYQGKYFTLEKQIENFNPDEKIAELENKYNLAKEEISIQSEALKQKQSLLIILAFALLLVVFACITIIQYLRLRSRKQVTELMQDNLRAQMNPHFIFNVLNSINSYILKNDKESSSKYLLKFASLLRLTLDNAQNSMVSINDEIESLRLYLELEAMRLNHKLEYEIQIDEEIDTQMFKIPTLLLQPYVENSIIHGIQNKENTGHLLIRLDYKDNLIHCSITDDGIGRKKADELKAGKENSHKSYGTKITETRLKLLNSFYGRKLGVKYSDSVTDSLTNKGTKVEFDLPIMN